MNSANVYRLRGKQASISIRPQTQTCLSGPALRQLVQRAPKGVLVQALASGGILGKITKVADKLACRDGK